MCVLVYLPYWTMSSLRTGTILYSPFHLQDTQLFNKCWLEWMNMCVSVCPPMCRRPRPQPRLPTTLHGFPKEEQRWKERGNKRAMLFLDWPASSSRRYLATGLWLNCDGLRQNSLNNGMSLLPGQCLAPQAPLRPDVFKVTLSGWLLLLKMNLFGHVWNAREEVNQGDNQEDSVSLPQGHFHLFTGKMRRNRCLT